MNLPEKLKLVKCSKDYPYKFILANTQESVTIDARKLGAEEQLKADQETYTQALEKIKELKSINESHRKLNGELRERIKELEETALTKEEAGFIVEYFGVTDSASDFYLNSIPFYTQVIAKLQKIIGKEK
jgi:hypothetical protein